MKRKASSDAAYAAAQAWALGAPFEELRLGNADRVSRSYGITPKQADEIITDAYRQRRTR